MREDFSPSSAHRRV